MNLRGMKEEDLGEVNLLLSKAFTHARYQNGFRSGRVPLCRLSFLRLYLDANLSGCWVIEKDCRVLAFCFSRFWGSVGWLGPLGVDPTVEGQGYGKEIVNKIVTGLKTSGAKTIGLETSAHSSKNLAFYTKLGFCASGLTVDLIRKIPALSRIEDGSKYKFVRYSEVTRQSRLEFLRKAKSLWESLQPGLDYTNEVELTCTSQFGDAALLLESQKAIGFVLAHTQTYSQEEERQFIKINVLQLSPLAKLSTLDVLIYFIEKWALAEKLTAVYVRTPTRYEGAFSKLLEDGFSIVQNDLRLTLRGFEQKDKPTMVNFSKWE